MSDLIGIWVGAILTLLVFSYLLKDSPLFRLAQAIFVGVAVGYAVAVAIRSVLLPRLIVPLMADSDASAILLIPLVLGLALFAKLRAAWAPLGNISMAFLFGVGSALALGGALSGALLPQLSATAVSLSPRQGWDTAVSNLLLVIGTVGAFLSFRFVVFGESRLGGRAVNTVARGWGYLGRWFVLIAFGAIFADTAVSRISILVGRAYFLLHDWLQVVK